MMLPEDARLAVGVVGSSGRIGPTFGLPTRELLNRLGGNSGNLVFQSAIRQLIGEPVVEVLGATVSSVAETRERCRLMVIPSANFIRADFELAQFVDFLEKIDMPLLFVGLGAQAISESVSTLPLHPSILRLIAIATERSAKICVRGHYTAELLSKMGVRNVSVTGCPSNFLNPDPDLPALLERRWQEEPLSLHAVGDEPWPHNTAKLEVERWLVSAVQRTGGCYVQQSVEPFVRLLRSRNSYSGAEFSEEHFSSLNASLAPTFSSEEFRHFLSRTVRLYFDVNQWMEDASRFSLSAGLRLHGNMVAHQAGCPAIWIPHDSRTLELVDCMALPHVTLERARIGFRDLTELKESATVDYKAYGARRTVLEERLHEAIVLSGITLSARTPSNRNDSVAHADQ